MKEKFTRMILEISLSLIVKKARIVKFCYIKIDMHAKFTFQMNTIGIKSRHVDEMVMTSEFGEHGTFALSDCDVIHRDGIILVSIEILIGLRI